MLSFKFREAAQQIACLAPSPSVLRIPVCFRQTYMQKSSAPEEAEPYNEHQIGNDLSANDNSKFYFNPRIVFVAQIVDAVIVDNVQIVPVIPVVGPRLLQNKGKP